jgi:CIC family chloride channel protein
LTEFEVPHRLRAFVRAREFSLILLAAVVGALAGVVVTLMSSGVDLLHSLFFGLPLGQRLSALTSLDPVLAMLVRTSVPTLGGLVLGVAYTFIAAWRPAREVDPIEANALHGGRMSLTGSVIVALQTIWSSGVGASVGTEAGYTQFASGIASRIGRAFRLRRADSSILVARRCRRHRIARRSRRLLRLRTRDRNYSATARAGRDRSHRLYGRR